MIVYAIYYIVNIFILRSFFFDAKKNEPKIT